MWLKILVILLNVVLIFLLSRLLEVAQWLETGFVPTQMLNPLSLSVQNLQKILEVRGVSHVGVVEKRELSALVTTTGEVTHGEFAEINEMEIAKTKANSDRHYTEVDPSTHFTGGSHFYEEVEDTKDSVWIVQVVDGTSLTPLLDDKSWQQIVMKLQPFGIRMGIFYCRLDSSLCNKKGWHSSQILLAVPKGNRVKGSVVLRYYSGPSKPKPIFDWVRRELHSKIQILSTNQLPDKLKFSDGVDLEEEPKVRVILMTTEKEAPLFLSSLSAKFASRVSFGIVTVQEYRGTGWQIFQEQRLPMIIVATPEKVFIYGNKRGEHLNYRSMEFFLKTLQPEMNDAFLACLYLINLVVCMDFFVKKERICHHCMRCFWSVAKYNCVLFLLFLMVQGLHSFSLMVSISELCLQITRIMGTTHIARILLFDLRIWFSVPLLMALSIVAICVVHGFLRKLWPGHWDNSEGMGAQSNDSFLMDWFFRPMVTLTRPITISELGLEDGMELFIERLAVPNLWLQPIISVDYISFLPTWKYTEIPPSDQSTSSSENEQTYLSGASDEEPRKSVNNCNQNSSSNSKKRLTSNSGQKCCLQPSAGTFWQGLRFSTIQQLKMAVSRFGRDHLYPHFCRGKSTSRKSRKEAITSKPPPGTLLSTDCAICLESYTYGSILCVLPCGHNYHQNCILSWLYRDHHHCPVCRWPSYKDKPVNFKVGQRIY